MNVLDRLAGHLFVTATREPNDLCMKKNAICLQLKLNRILNQSFILDMNDRSKGQKRDRRTDKRRERHSYSSNVT